MTELFWISYAGLWIVILVQGFAFVEVLRQMGSLREHLPPQRPLIVGDFLAMGGELPSLSAVSAATLQVARWEDYLVKGTNALLFLTTRCPHCYALAQDLAAYAERLRSKVGVVAILNASPEEAEKFIASTGLDPALVAIDSGGRTAETLGIRFAPGAVLVQDRRMGQAAIVTNVDQLDALVDRGLIRLDELREELRKKDSQQALLQRGIQSAAKVSEVE